MDTILSRIQELAATEGITIGALERVIGASKGVLSRAISNGTDIQSKWIQRLVENYPQYSANWLLSGKGDKFSEKSKDLPTINQDFIGAPCYNVDFIGGFDIVMNDQTTNPDYYINYPPYNKEGVVWCNLTGHSMEPELSNGDTIALKELTTPIQFLPSGEIYSIVTEEYRTVKRIRLSSKEGYVRLIPSNKSEEYCEQEIPISMIIKVYAVLGSIRKFF